MLMEHQNLQTDSKNFKKFSSDFGFSFTITDFNRLVYYQYICLNKSTTVQKKEQELNER